jgi:hypothetical protein
MVSSTIFSLPSLTFFLRQIGTEPKAEILLRPKVCYRYCRCAVGGQCSSAVEQRFRKPSVAGSIPAIGSILLLVSMLQFGFRRRFFFKLREPTSTAAKPNDRKPAIGVSLGM